MDEQTQNEPVSPLVPWEEPVDADEAPVRRDAFAGEKRRKFLKALAKTGCIAEACRAARISRETAYAHERQDPEFARHCEMARAMSETEVELEAWQRGVIGIEEPVFAYGKMVGTRVRRSDAILRLLLQGSNLKKYGPQPRISRQRILKAERKEMEKEAERKAEARVMKIIQEVIRRREAEQREDAAPAAAAEEEQEVSDSASDSSDSSDSPPLHDPLSRPGVTEGSGDKG